MMKFGSRSSSADLTKIFSPRTRSDWETFVKSAEPLRDPNMIIDITSPKDGCAGCTAFPMNSKVPEFKDFKTSDGSPWWLRSTKYQEPNGDYHANCYLNLWNDIANEDSVTFSDGSCG